MGLNPNSDVPIAALATPPGFGALAIIRVSGPDLTTLINLFTKKLSLKNRVVKIASLYNPQTGTILDRCLITYFISPNSFTGEDVLEISCHGGDYVPQSILEALFANGVRHAQAGEFSFRAFLNNKLDLIQAESTATLIASKSKNTAEASLTNLTGFFANSIISIRKRLLRLLFTLEKELDFTENEITFLSKKNIIKDLKFVGLGLSDLLNTAAFGKIITSGARVVFLGKPNAGKSSLFNHLLGKNRSIVSDIPGTTRDTVESWIEVNGYSVCLVDTAGCWESQDYLESLGIQKTLEQLACADIVLFVDDKNPVASFNSLSIKTENETVVFVKSKSEKTKKNKKNIIYTSVKTGVGIKNLIDEIGIKLDVLSKTTNKNTPVIMSTRQKTFIEDASKNIQQVLSLIENNNNTDIAVSLLRGCLDSLESIIGVVDNEEIINNIFNEFCIGK